MAAEMQKMIVVPVDGSENSVKALAYTNLMFGPKHNLNVTVFHVLPSLPHFLIEESGKDAKIAEQLQNLKKKNIGLAQRLLTDAKNKLVKTGFADQAVETVYQERRVGIARDICDWAESHRAGAADAECRAVRGRVAPGPGVCPGGVAWRRTPPPAPRSIPLGSPRGSLPGPPPGAPAARREWRGWPAPGLRSGRVLAARQAIAPQRLR